MKIPDPKLLAGLNEVLPHAFVGDEIFGLSISLLRPYGGHSLVDHKKAFNYRLSRERRYVECDFGISNKWRMFHKPLNVNVKFAIGIVKACCLLHNFVRQREGVRLDDILVINRLEDATDSGQVFQGGRYAKECRDKFSTYFTSDVGKLP